MPPQPPIIVIADDLSGAAEVAAIAASRGLTTEVHRHFDPTSPAQVIAIDTDSRSLSPGQAAGRIRDLAAKIPPSHAYIFKKTDSVLRGHPRAEIEALLDTLQLSRAIFVPANPSRGRTIADAQYLINGIPLDQTHFFHDEEFPRHSADVAKLLNFAGNCAIHTGEMLGDTPKSGIIVPDASSIVDLERLASCVDESTLPAGAADFFSVILDRWCSSSANTSHQSVSTSIVRPALLICGSLAAWRERSEQCRAANLAVVTAKTADTMDCLITKLPQDGAFVLATQTEPALHHQRQKLLTTLGKAAAAIIERTRPATILIEGGATAAAVTTELNWQRFSVEPFAASGAGFVRPLAADFAPLLLIKPGSYSWPEEIWEAFCNCAAD
jgi:uncharacterized protein YgbK (DUF1537 family)